MAEPFEHDEVQPRRKSKLWTVCPYILGNEFCERLAYYGIAKNLVIYLTTVMTLTNGQASVQTSLFSGTCYLTPLIGAWLADGYWGRFKTIMVFSTIYALGMAALALTALIPSLSPQAGAAPTPLQLTILYVSLYVVALGTGGIKPNVSAFGADQFDDKSRVERREKQSFFNWFYFVINVGSLIAVTAIVWVQGWSWGLGFAIPAAAMFLAVLIFVAGHPLYHHELPKGSPIERMCDMTWHASLHALSRLCCCGTTDDGAPDPDDVSLLYTPVVPPSPSPSGRRDSLEIAGTRRGYTHEQIEEVRAVLRMGPIFLLTISYWTLYTQMATVFIVQANHMDTTISLGGRQVRVPPASMTLFDTVSIIVLIPIYDGILHPLMKRLRCELSMLQRIGWGFLVIAGAMLAAGLVERRRMAAVAAGGNIKVTEQVLQYLLVGASEVLASIGQLEFFYDQAPDVMRSCCGALSLLSTALGGYLSALLMAAVDSWTTWLDNLDGPDINSRLDLYFFVLAALMLFFTLVFVAVAMGYEYRVVRHRAPLPLIGGQQSHTVPPRLGGGQQGAGAPSSAAAIDISRGVRPGYGYQYSGTPSTLTADDPHGRSVTYMPGTPVLPPNFK